MKKSACPVMIYPVDCQMSHPSYSLRTSDERFIYMMDYWLRTLGADQFVTFKCNSVECQINDNCFHMWRWHDVKSMNICFSSAMIFGCACLEKIDLLNGTSIAFGGQ